MSSSAPVKDGLCEPPLLWMKGSLLSGITSKVTGGEAGELLKSTRSFMKGEPPERTSIIEVFLRGLRIEGLYKAVIY